MTLEEQEKEGRLKCEECHCVGGICDQGKRGHGIRTIPADDLLVSLRFRSFLPTNYLQSRCILNRFNPTPILRRSSSLLSGTLRLEMRTSLTP